MVDLVYTDFVEVAVNDATQRNATRRRSSFVVRRSSFVVRRSSFVVAV